MGTIQRYVVFETLKVLTAALAATSLLLILGGGLREGVRQGLPLLVAMRTVPFLVPEMLRLTIPASLLFAICTVFGRMSATEEITALKSLGINPMRIVAPVLIVAYLLSLVTFCLYDVCATWSRPGLYRLAVSCVDEVAYRALRADSVFKAAGVTVSVQGVVDDKLIEPRVQIAKSAGMPAMLLRAREATLEAVPSTGKLRIRCCDSHIKISGQVTISYPGQFTHEVQIRPTLAGDDATRSPAELRMSAIPRQIDDSQQMIDRLQPEIASDDSSKQLQRAQYQARLFRLQAESQRRLSNGFAVFAFAMIGIPVAVWWRSSDNMSIFFTCFAPISFIYYPLLAVGETIARQGIMPHVSVWLAPAVLIVAGVALFVGMIRR